MMIKCKECGHSISTEAKSCPKCGAVSPLEPQGHGGAHFMFWILHIAAALFGFVFLVVTIPLHLIFAATAK